MLTTLTETLKKYWMYLVGAFALWFFFMRGGRAKSNYRKGRSKMSRGVSKLAQKYAYLKGKLSSKAKRY